MSEPRAPRFSDAALKVLVEQVRAHKEVLFPSDGRKMPRQTLRQAWREVALYVNMKSVTPRTWLQCRKKFNDLTRTARDKLAHKPRNLTSSGERPASFQATTPMEQEALDIVEIYSRRVVENGEAGGLSHYLDLTGQEMEEDHFIEDAPSPAPSYQYTGTGLGVSGGRDGQLEGSTQGELFSTSEQELAIVERTAEVETDGRRASSDSSYAEEHKDADYSGPAFKRKIFHVHHQLLEALDSLSRSCLTLSESVEESASILCGVLPQGISTLQATMEHVASSVDTAVRPSVQEPVAPALASLIEAQTGAIQALACTISSGLERLGGRIDRGFSRVTDLLQSALPQVSDGAETQIHGNGTMGAAHATLAPDNSTPAPSPRPPPPTASVAAAILQSAVRPSRTRALRGRRP
uniref:myb-related transcription factor, partner of profilin-like isoform X2 n=1 Tax=Pristiophorus japonicus TaxID=55135 RepID=UPI00398EBF59